MGPVLNLSAFMCIMVMSISPLVAAILITPTDLVTSMAKVASTRGVTEANVRRVTRGMTVHQVEAIFGGSTLDIGFSISNAGRTWEYVWTGLEGTAWVSFREYGPKKIMKVDISFFLKSDRPKIGDRH